MTERNQFIRSLGGHNAGNTRCCQNIAFRYPAVFHSIITLAVHRNRTGRYCRTYRTALFTHVNHMGVSFFIYMCTKIIEDKQEALLRVKKEMKQAVTTGTTERNWVTLFKQYENVEELNRRVLMSLVDRILIHENHAIEIVFKYKDEYQQTLEYVLGYADELDIAV